MVTKSTTPAATKTAPAAAPAAPAPATAGQSYGGRINPLSAIMRLTIGKDPTPQESAELAKFISKVVRLTDTHVYAVAKFFSKRYHVQLSTLVIKIAKYQASLNEDLTVQSAKTALEDFLGIPIAEYDGIEGNYTNEYTGLLLEDVKAAHERLWNAYGKQGSEVAGLIDQANAYDQETRANRQAEAMPE